MSELMREVTNKVETGTKKVKDTFRNFITTITLLVLVILTIAISLCELAFKDSIDTSFWINLAYMVFISIVALLTLLPLGKDSEKKSLKGYYENREVWAGKTTTINNGKSTEFNKYCEEYTNKLRRKKREHYVQIASIDLNDFYTIFDKMTPKELREYYKKYKQKQKWLANPIKYAQELKESDELGKYTIPLSYIQYRLVLRTKKPIRVKPVIPTKILSNSNNKNEAQVGQQGVPYVAKVITMRIFGIIAYSLLLVSVMIVPTGVGGWETICIIMMRLVGLITSAVMGFYAGRIVIQNDNSDTLDRITFQNGFLEQQGIQEKQQLNL